MPSQTQYKLRTTFAFKLPSGERFNLELATGVQSPNETKPTDPVPSHGQASPYIPKRARATIELAAVQVKFYENTLAPAQYQLELAKNRGTVLNCFEIWGEMDVPTGKNYSAQVTGFARDEYTTEGMKMATVDLELTTGVTRGTLTTALAA